MGWAPVGRKYVAAMVAMERPITQSLARSAAYVDLRSIADHGYYMVNGHILF
jgi:hypothetical protein